MQEKVGAKEREQLEDAMLCALTVRMKTQQTKGIIQGAKNAAKKGWDSVKGWGKKKPSDVQTQVIQTAGHEITKVLNGTQPPPEAQKPTVEELMKVRLPLQWQQELAEEIQKQANLGFATKEKTWTAIVGDGKDAIEGWSYAVVEEFEQQLRNRKLMQLLYRLNLGNEVASQLALVTAVQQVRVVLVWIAALIAAILAIWLVAIQ